MGLHSGWDVKTAAPGTADGMRCDTCGQSMTVERGVVAATSYAEAMAKRSHEHDRFVCPSAGEGWHDQAIKLHKMAEHFDCSPNLRSGVLLDLSDVLRSRGLSLMNLPLRPSPHDDAAAIAKAEG